MVAGFLGVLIFGLLVLLLVEGIRKRADDDGDTLEQELAEIPPVTLSKHGRGAMDPSAATAYGIGAAPTERRS